jgi:hypothetical protein
MRIRTLVVVGMLAAAPAAALDQPIAGAKLLLRRSTSGGERLVFVSKDPAFLFPALAGGDDPSTGSSSGLVVEVFTSAEPLGVALTAPAGSGVPGWTAHPGIPPRLRFVNRGAPDALSSFRKIVLTDDKVLKVGGREVGLALTAPLGSVGIRITTGTLRNCALFGPSTVRSDVAGAFVAKSAPATAIADCSNASLGGVEPTCGDDVVNQSSEECDGSAACSFGAGFDCGPPGFSTACQCCTYGGPNSAFVPCCNPSSIFLPYPDSNGDCLPTRCDPPFDCEGRQCEPDGSCCSAGGQTCIGWAPNLPSGWLLLPCCPGLECRSPDGFGGIDCCVSDGDACATDTECCTGHCVAGTCEPCRGTGSSCVSPFECCSLSCTAGLCDACAAVGANCLSNATCCSGSCDLTTYTCAP